MCGIVGFASSEGMKNRALRQHYMEQGLAMDSFRGWDSTGIAAVENLKEAPVTYKRALNGFDFIQQARTQRLLSDVEKYQVMIGHNRSATKGSVNDNNAHPFQYDHITLVHNGHVSNAFDLPNNANADNYVDSARVALSMARNGEKETLELCEGGYTFVWWNQETQLLNIARNDKRPLWIGFAEGENTMFWASEWELLNLLVYRNGGVLEEHTVMFPEVSTWYQYSLKDLRAVTKVPFVLSQGRRSTQGSQGNTSGTGTGGGDATQDWEKELAEWNKHLTDIRTTGGKEETTDEIEEIRQDAAAVRQAPSEERSSGIPTTKKKIAKATQELRKLGIGWREKSLCSPVSWIKYKNQIKLGTVLAHSRKYGFTVEILNVSASDYADFNTRGLVAVELVNVRHRRGTEHGTLKTQLVGVVSDSMTKYLERHKSLKEAIPEGDPGHGVALIYTGKSGNLVSLERFKELTSTGCGWCCERPDPDSHDRLVWLAGGEFLCASCATDKDVRENVGIIANDDPSYVAVH